MKRILLSISALLLAACSLHAQEWARARLEKSPRHGEWVKLKHDGREVDSFITYPEVKDKATAVVVIHEIFGLTDWARGVTDQLAEAGYIAISPDLLSGKGPHGGGTEDIGAAGDGAGKACIMVRCHRRKSPPTSKPPWIMFPSCRPATARWL